MAKTTIPGEYLADGGITTAKIADDAVTSAKLDTNIDLAGTLDVTGAATLDSTLSVAGDITLLGFPESAYEIKGDIDGGVRFQAQAAETLAKGDAVYISGAAGDNALVSKARSNSASTMPAFGLVVFGAASGSPVQVVTLGNLYGSGTAALNTSSYSVGDNLYVSAATAGALTATAPTGEANLIQNLGKVVRSHATNGVIRVGGAGRTNATPNLNQGKIFIGNASNQSVSSAYTLPIADGTDGQVLTTDGSGAVAFEALPASGPTFKTFGTDSIMIGDTTTGTIDAANYNVGLGVDVFAALTSGDYNVAVGTSSLFVNTTGSNNTAVGRNALVANTTGSANIAIGSLALGANTEASNNIAVGKDALGATTTGAGNTAVGSAALYLNTTASNNTAVGLLALAANTTGTRNTAVGTSALDANTTASYNTSVGYLSSSANTTGEYNTALGDNSLATNTTGSTNTAVGNYSLGSSTTASNNTAVGYASLFANTTGGSNVAVGKNALLTNTTGQLNIAVGQDTLGLNTTGTHNTAVGETCMNSNTTASNNTALGASALRANTTGAQNTAVGTSAGLRITTGSYNTILGKQAGEWITTGNDNIIIGYLTGAHSTGFATGYQNIVLGNYADLATTSTINANIIGYNLTGSSGYTTLGNTASAIRTAHGSTAWAVVSDERVKKDITNATAGLSFINDLKPKTFKYKNLGEIPSEFKGYKEGSTEVYKNANTNHGFIAQEVKAAIDNHPEIKNGFAMWDVVEETGQQEVAETALIPMLVKAIQELSAEVEKLKGE